MTFIVAEIGVNWDGDFQLAKQMIEKAKQVGCNAVKFQAFDESNIKNHPEMIRLMNSSISKKNIDTIDSLAKSAGIEWFCTPMYSMAVDLLDPYVSRFKIREIDGRTLIQNNKSDIVEKILKTNKEVIVSSQKSPKECMYHNNTNFKWLYCVPKYPCEFSDIDFTHLNEFDGYSNHVNHIIAPITAAILGAKIIEIHITSNKSGNFIDNNVSLDYSELEQMVNLIRLSEQIVR